MKPPLDDHVAPNGWEPRRSPGCACPAGRCALPRLCARLDLQGARSMPRPAIQRHGKSALDWAAAVALSLAVLAGLAWAAHWLWRVL